MLETVVFVFFVAHAHKGDVGQTNKVENRYEMRLHEVEMREVAAGIRGAVARGCDHHDRLGGNQRAIGPGRIVKVKSECFPNSDDLVDVRLELCGNSEVLHRDAEHDCICPNDLLNHRVAQR